MRVCGHFEARRTTRHDPNVITPKRNVVSSSLAGGARAAPEAHSYKGFRRCLFWPAASRKRHRCRAAVPLSACMSLLRLKAQHDPAALGVVAAQTAQPMALHVRAGVLLLDLRAKLQRQPRILTVSDPDAAALVAQLLHCVQHELPRFPQAPALLQHLKGALRAGLSHGADAEDAGHCRRQLADAAVLRQIVHGFQRKEQMGTALILLYGCADLLEALAGAQFGG